MHVKPLLLGLLVFCSLTALGQNANLKGRVMDTLEKKPLANAVIAVIRSSDSVLIRFTRSAADGSFQLDSLPNGTFRYQVTYPKFADFADEVTLNGNVADLGTVPLTLRAQLLDRVVIRSAGAIRIKGDTTEFVADSFKVKDGATVEDLLKRFPGFQVNNKGEITAQGQKVDKVLVDGEEFFGNDPTMATQNLSAKAVDKVQVFDSKSEAQKLTGLSSGTEGKTVNIKLKDEAKKGGFGRAHAASDFNRYHDAKLLANRFTKTQKMSVYGTHSTTNSNSLNWSDRQQLGIDEEWEYDEVNDYYTSFNSDGEFSSYAVQGLPRSYTAGGLYSNKWNADKQNINASYRYNWLETRNDASTRTQNLLASGVTYQNQDRFTNSLLQRHAGNLKYEWKIDSLRKIKLSSNGSHRTGEVRTSNASEYLGTLKEFRNRSRQVTNNSTDKKELQNVLTYTQNFKKPNRTFLANFRLGFIDDNDRLINQTQTEFYNGQGVVDSTDIADQLRLRNGHSTTWGTKLTWSEPLKNNWALVFDYGYNRNVSTSDRNTYNKTTTGKYDDYDPLFSNNFELGAHSHNGKVSINHRDKKWNFVAAGGISSIRLRLFNKDNGQTNIYHFFNFTPQFNLGYTIRPQTGIRFMYIGSTRQPGIEQLQPIRDNANRLNVFVGNPNLRVGFQHNFRITYNSFKTLKQKYFFATGNFTLPTNAITYLTVFDPGRGKQTTTPVNVNGNYNWNVFSSLYRQSAPKKLRPGLFGYAGGGRNNNFVNGVKNVTEFSNINFGPQLEYSWKDGESNVNLRPTAGYNVSKSSLRPESNTRYWSLGGNASADVLLGKNGRWEVRPNSISCKSSKRSMLLAHQAAFSGRPNWEENS